MAQREEETELKVPDNVALCAKSCGRPGHDKPRSSPPRAQDSPVAATVDARGGEGPSGAAVTEETATPAAAPARAVRRCSGCGRKVGLTGFRCRCGDLFCAEHRYSDRHDCSYDYKAAGREAIRRDNPAVRAAKLVRI